jgi:broad specificity phosphatase PhoE
MSSLLFVRHAQASLFAQDYDQLSEHGFRQAELLGEFFKAQQQSIDRVFVGPRRRHRQTAQTALESAALESGSPTSLEIVEIPALDEHQVDRLVSEHAAEIGKQFPEISRLGAAFRDAATDRDRRRAFAMLFEAVANLWIHGRCPPFDVETWVDFRARVNAGIDQMIAHTGSGRTAIAFVSAGTIAAAMSRALRCPDEVALGLGWRVWNCSITTCAFSRDRFSLDQFNAIPHLRNQTDWTYR